MNRVSLELENIDRIIDFFTLYLDMYMRYLFLPLFWTYFEVKL